MPEGPSLVILREESARFVGQAIVRADGNTKTVAPASLAGQPVLSMRSWGKHFIIETPALVLRIHFMLFGSYRIDQPKDSPARLALHFADGGALYFYACSVKPVEPDLDAAYDWDADIMSPTWDPAKARKKLRAQPATLVCDALLDQAIFAGVGNIIKNEVLFRIRLHPLSQVGALPAAKLRQLVEQARQYSFDFLAWKKQFVLKKHWLAHARTTCARCQLPLCKAHLGTARRRTFYCEHCQKRYNIDL